MIPTIREKYNREFTPEKYQAFLNEIKSWFDHIPSFRIAETPVFLPPELKKRLYEACEEIMHPILADDFLERSQGALKDVDIVPNEDDHTIFLQMDFGITRNGNGELIPQLIEIQGFPSLYFYQDYVAKAYLHHFYVPDQFHYLYDGIDEREYYALLRKEIIGDCDPENVILLEVEPEKQMTRIDFLIGEKELGFHTVCISKLEKEGKDLFYRNEEDRKVPVHRIFNRVIFDELIKRKDLERSFYFADPVNVEWVGHPNWFFRISKYTLPLLKSQYVPDSWFLNELHELPEDLQNYVLKPLFSFSGSGVIFHVNKEDIEGLPDPENYLLQQKIKYEPVITTPNEPVKCEIRMLMIWPKEEEKPRIINNLARLSKGEMIGVRYNKDKDWVGGSVCFFE